MDTPLIRTLDTPLIRTLDTPLILTLDTPLILTLFMAPSVSVLKEVNLLAIATTKKVQRY